MAALPGRNYFTRIAIDGKIYERKPSAELEHFQNQFIREKEVIDELRHDIKKSENEVEKEHKDNPVAIEHRWFRDHTDLRDRFETFERLYTELKTEYRRWFAQRL